MTDNADQAARMRAMWSAVALTSLNDAIRHTARESKKNKGQALNSLALWAKLTEWSGSAQSGWHRPRQAYH